MEGKMRQREHDDGCMPDVGSQASNRQGTPKKYQGIESGVLKKWNPVISSPNPKRRVLKKNHLKKTSASHPTHLKKINTNKGEGGIDQVVC